MELKAVDVVGCSSGEGTRSCVCHEVCGDSLSVDNIVVIRWEAILDISDTASEFKFNYHVNSTNQ